MKTIGSTGLLALGLLCGSITVAADAAPGTTSDTAGETLETVVVTGSRIAQSVGATAPTPVTSLSAEELLTTAPSNIPDALNKLPQFTGSTSESQGGTFNAGSAPLGNYLNLRGLDTSRLLVLLNGQRVTPTNRTAAVDANVLPQMLVSRVDVVTGGASAVYGSDAVSGVVNYVLDDKYEGLKANVQGGTSSQGDSKSYRVGLAGGMKAGQRLHLLGSIETYKNDGLPHLYDRSWAPNAFAQVNPGGGQPIIFVPEVTRYQISDAGTLDTTSPGVNAALVGYYPDANGHRVNAIFNPDGSIRPMDMGTWYGNTTSGGEGGKWGTPENGGNTIVGSLRTVQGFGRATLDVTDTTSAYVQAIYSTSDTGFFSAPNNHIGNGSRQTWIYLDNPYLANLQADARARLVNAGVDHVVVGRIFNERLVTAKTGNKYQSAQVGFKGQFTDNWHWDGVYNYGKATQNASFNEFEMRKFWAAIDAVRDPATGNIVCGVTLRNPTLLPGCVPMNVLGTGNLSTAAMDWARGTSAWEITNEMKYVNFNIQGDLFNIPAGPVKLAAGAEYRTQDLNITSNSDPAFFQTASGLDLAKINAYYQGIRGVPIPTSTTGAAPLLFDSINVGLANGSQTVKEAYAEFQVPLHRTLSLDLAARSTDYKTSGRVTTWKAGASWQPVQSLRFRVNRSQDIAAPGLYALYAGPNVTFASFNDTHVQPALGLVPKYTSVGNPNLRPETAKTTTIGVVLQPTSISGLVASIDWYDIDLSGAIEAPNVAQQFNECEASNGTADVCQFFIRNPNLPWSDRTAANAVTAIVQLNQNLAFLKTSGVDIEVGYRFNVAGGRLNLRAIANYLSKFETQGSASAAPVDWVGHIYGTQATTSAGSGLPRWKGMLSQAYSYGDTSVSVSERFTGSFRYNFAAPSEVYATPLDLPNKMYIDVNLSRNLGPRGNYQAVLNVRNLTDVNPPITPIQVTNLNVPTNKGSYDVIGRYFTAGVRVQF